MKYCSLLLMFCAFSANSNPAKAATPEKLPDYQVTSITTDKNLSASESVFDFTFLHNTSNSPVVVAIRYSYNGKEQYSTRNDQGKHELKLKPGKYMFMFWYNTAHQEVYTDSIDIKGRQRIAMNVYFTPAEQMAKPAKPVIYLYPTEPTQVSVQLDLKGHFTFTYPAYENGWSVKAYPNGTLEQNGKTYNYLFWEGDMLLSTALNEGFVKTNSELTAFFEEKLACIGFNSKEIQDYITYWVPRMHSTGKPKHFIRFVINEEYDRYATISVTPKPDQMIRVLMGWCPLNQDQPIEITEQKLPSFKRHGFTLVEWGGTEIKNEF